MPSKKQLDDFREMFEKMTYDAVLDIELASKDRLYQQMFKLRGLAIELEKIIKSFGYDELSILPMEFQFLYYYGYVIFGLIHRLQLVYDAKNYKE
jgi:hypothetical protein